MDNDLYNYVEFGSAFTVGHNSSAYKLRRKVGPFEKQSSWKIFDNLSKSEMFRMYVSANILKTIFPDSKFYDLLFVRFANGRIHLATRSDIELTHFDKECKAGSIPFNCLHGRCEIEDTGFVKINPVLSRSVYYESPLRSQQCVENSSEINGGFAWNNPLPFDYRREVEDFETVFLATLMLDTHLVYCNDFALKFKDDAISIRLHNLGDNFLSLTNHNPSYSNLLSVKLTGQYEPWILKPLEDFETNVYLRLMRILPKEFLNKMSYLRLIDAIETILHKKDKLAVIAKESIADTMQIFGESILKELTFEKSPFSKYREKIMSFDTLKRYVSDLFDINIKNLDKFRLCIEIETALNENNKDKLFNLLYDDLIKDSPLCLSIYRLPEVQGYIDASQFVLCKMAKTFKYQNEAADLLNSYCRGEVHLPEIEPDTLINEL